MCDKDTLEQPPEEGIEIEPLDKLDCLELEKTIINEWGMQRSSLDRLIYCGITVRCLELMQDSDINELFNDQRMLEQKVIFKHRKKELQTNNQLKLASARKKRHSAPEVRFNQKLGVLSAPSSLTILSDSMQHPLFTDASLQEPEQSLESSDQAIGLPDHHSSLIENGTFIKPTTAGNLPIRMSADGLRKLLQSSRQGQWVLSYYSIHDKLHPTFQAHLTQCIVEPFLEYNIMFSHWLMRHYSQIITQLFDTECAEVYFKPPWKRTRVSGKLKNYWDGQRVRHKVRYPQHRPRILDATSGERTFAEMSLVMGQTANHSV